ncbi:hypothetical protein [Demequina sp. NBRC 110056]|uniref:hypothetical protein n=1 Tax=Demequina sp. NBRC 110056 TaxID=1570345 RepID=UPI000A03A88F|nr:hypothetical protein [Demequina sp. NBRC 110056]
MSESAPGGAGTGWTPGTTPPPPHGGTPEESHGEQPPTSEAAPTAWAAPGSTPPATGATPAPPASAPPGFSQAPAPHTPGAYAPAPQGTPAPAPASAYPPPAGPAYGAAPLRPAAVNAAPTYRSWQPGIIPLRPLSFGDFLSVPFKAMRFNRAVVLGGPLLFTLITAALTMTAMWLVFTDARLGLLDATPSLDGINVQTVVLLVLAVVSLFLTDVLCSSIVAPGVARAVMGERISLAVAWRQMRRKLGALLLIYVATGVVYGVLVFVVFIPALVSGLTSDDSVGAVLLTVALALLVLVPAGMVVTVLQGIVRAMVVLEGIGAVAAVKRVFPLIRRRFWWSILIVFVTGLLINVVASTLQYVGQFAALIATVIAPENVAVLAISFFAVYGLALVISLVATYAYMGSVFSLLYIDLRMRHEGFDLDLARAAEARAAAQAGR